MRSIVFTLGFVALAVPARAQTVLYQTQFDDATGWTLEPPVNGDPGWAVDGLPASTPFAPYRSAPSSLNYNNDFDYNFWGGAALLTLEARSPLIDLSLASGVPVLAFWCNNRSQEGMCDIHELLRVNVLSGTTLKAQECIHWQEPPATCRNAGGWPGWHRHVMELDRTWGNVHAVFDTRVDGIANDTEGWFIDDLEVRDWPVPGTYCTAKINSQGCTPIIGFVGTPSLETSPTFRVVASDVLNNKLGILFYGVSGPAASPFMGGTLCVAGTKKRTPLQSSGGNPPPNDCSGTFTFDVLAWQASGADPNLVEGTRVNAQYWYRDSASSFDVGLTDAVEFTLRP